MDGAGENIVSSWSSPPLTDVRAGDGRVHADDPVAEVAGEADHRAVADLGDVALAAGRCRAGLHPAHVPRRDLHQGVQPGEVLADRRVVELAAVTGEVGQLLHPAAPDAGSAELGLAADERPAGWWRWPAIVPATPR